MGKDRSMAIKHAKAKKEAMKEVMNNKMTLHKLHGDLLTICVNGSRQNHMH